MKYDDDELAEAAILLGLVEQTDPLPVALRAKILERGRSAVAEARYTTTKAAALSLEHEAEPVRRSTNVAAWVGWLAAAACFAFGIYQWRASSLLHVGAARATSVLRDSAGKEMGTVSLDDTGRGELVVAALPANTPGEHYRVWISPRGAESRVVGTFVCESPCTRRAFALDDVGVVDKGARVSVARSRVDEPATVLSPKSVVGESAP